MTAYAPLALSSLSTPASQEESVDVVRAAFEMGTPVYPIGGGTSLDYGLVPKQPGIGVVLTSLHRVVDFPARDLTITVEAGITMQALADSLATEGLRLPIDVPQPDRATLGGVIATATSGPRRFGYGTIRDYVIGIRAVDGRGETFNGGGRVVKNVAGYDFCKLLTGSLGTLGIITQVTLKLRPLAARRALAVFRPVSLAAAEHLVADILQSDITPSAVELLCGPAWQKFAGQVDPSTSHIGPTVAVGLEGDAPEVEWMQQQLVRHAPQFVDGTAADALWRELADYPARAGAALVLKASLPSSAVARFIAAACEIDPGVSIAAHAGNAIVYARFSAVPKEGLSRTLVARLQPLAAASGGYVVVLSNAAGQEATPQSAWGTLGPSLEVMKAVKQQFDPRGILNTGRFVFA